MSLARFWLIMGDSCRTFHAYPDTWVKDANNKLVYGAMQPEMKQALLALQNMFKGGELDKEFGIKDFSKAAEMVAAEKCGIVFGGHWMPASPLSMNEENDPDSDWNCYMLPGVDVKTPMGELELGLSHIYVAKKGAKNPEAIVKLLNFHFEKLYGETGDYEHWGNDEIDGITFLSVTHVIAHLSTTYHI